MGSCWGLKRGGYAGLTGLRVLEARVVRFFDGRSRRVAGKGSQSFMWLIYEMIPPQHAPDYVRKTRWNEIAERVWCCCPLAGQGLSTAAQINLRLSVLNAYTATCSVLALPSMICDGKRWKFLEKL